MPKTYLYEDYFEQEWEPVVLSGGAGGGGDEAADRAPTFGSQLVEARRLAQATRHSVAQSIGVPLTTVEAWENNATHPTKAQIVRLNRVLRCGKKLK